MSIYLPTIIVAGLLLLAVIAVMRGGSVSFIDGKRAIVIKGGAADSSLDGEKQSEPNLHFPES